MVIAPITPYQLEVTLTSETSQYEAPPPPPQAERTSAGWTGSDLAIGSALIVLLVALFLPWFSGTVHLSGGSVTLSGTGNGLRAHGYLWVVFALVIAGLAVLVARDALGRVPGNLPSAEQMLVLATGLALLLTILGIAFKPSGYTTSSTGAIPQMFPHFTVSIGWSYGGFVAVLAAAVAFVAAVGSTGPLHSAGRAARAGWKPSESGS